MEFLVFRRLRELRIARAPLSRHRAITHRPFVLANCERLIRVWRGARARAPARINAFEGTGRGFLVLSRLRSFTPSENARTISSLLPAAVKINLLRFKKREREEVKRKGKKKEERIALSVGRGLDIWTRGVRSPGEISGKNKLYRYSSRCLRASASAQFTYLCL